MGKICFLKDFDVKEKVIGKDKIKYCISMGWGIFKFLNGFDIKEKLV